MMSAKLAILNPFKTKVFCKKGYGVVTSVSDVTNKILLRDVNSLWM